MADEGTEPTKDLNFAKNYPLMEGEGESCKCSSMCCNMFRLHWVENGQVSSFSFSLVGLNLRMLNTLT